MKTAIVLIICFSFLLSGCSSKSDITSSSVFMEDSLKNDITSDISTVEETVTSSKIVDSSSRDSVAQSSKPMDTSASSSSPAPTSSKKETSSVQTSSVYQSPQVVKPTTQMIQTIKTAFLDLVNCEREKLGLVPLVSNATLDAGAYVRAEECFEVFSHTRPNGESCFSLFEQGPYEYPYVSMGENITKTTNFGSGYITDDNVFVGKDSQLKDIATIFFSNFKNSPPHYSSIISDNFTETGVGIAFKVDDVNNILHLTCVQIFGDQ